MKSFMFEPNHPVPVSHDDEPSQQPKKDPPQKSHECQLPTPGWVPPMLLPSRPAMPLPPSAATARRLQANPARGTESTLHSPRNVGRPAAKSVCPPTPTTCNEGTQVKENGRPAAKSVCPPTPNSMKWNTRPMMPSSVGCEPSSPQAFLIFLNRETPSQHTLKVEVK